MENLWIKNRYLTMDPSRSPPSFQYMNSSTPAVDPVTKAVVDNILGKFQAKKEKVILTCTICDLEFSSQITLDMHLRGSRHSKKVQSQEILKSLKEKGSIIDNGSTNLRCDICDVVSNSSQQLQMHLQGAKHLNKTKARGTNGNTVTITSLKRTGSAPTKGSDGTPPTKTVSLRCDTCNISLNSESQFQQHVDSKKHQNKLVSKPSPKKWINKQSRPYFSRRINQLCPSAPSSFRTQMHDSMCATPRQALPAISHCQKQNNSYPHPQYQGNAYPGNVGSYQNSRKTILSGVPPLSQSFNMNNQGYDNYHHHNNGGGAPNMW